MNTQTARKTSDADIKAFVVPNKLTDGSFTYDVRIGSAVMHAYSQDEATQLAQGIAALIDKHTTDIVEIIYLNRG